MLLLLLVVLYSSLHMCDAQFLSSKAISRASTFA